MNPYDFAPIRALISVANTIVSTLSDLLEPLAGASAAALAVVVFTLVVRTLLIPVGLSQARAERTRRRLAPRLAELQQRYAKKPEVLQRKMMELYRSQNTTPFAGFGPVLLQMPVLIAVYGLFITPSIGGVPNRLLTHELISMPLGSSLLAVLGAGELTIAIAVLYTVLLAVIVAAAQASRQLLQSVPAVASAPQPGVPSLAGITRVLSFLPFLTAVIATFVPLAAALYLLVTTVWTLSERLVLRRVLDRAATAATRPEEDPGGAHAAKVG